MPLTLLISSDKHFRTTRSGRTGEGDLAAAKAQQISGQMSGCVSDLKDSEDLNKSQKGHMQK